MTEISSIKKKITRPALHCPGLPSTYITNFSVRALMSLAADGHGPTG